MNYSKSCVGVERNALLSYIDLAFVVPRAAIDVLIHKFTFTFKFPISLSCAICNKQHNHLF